MPARNNIVGPVKKPSELFSFYMCVSTILSLSVIAIVHYLFYSRPVSYTRLIAEDQWGEYGTCAAFTLAAALLMSLLFFRAPHLHKVIWLVLGLTALFIAGEEISWGQRIFHYSTPDWLYQRNTQHEVTLHNIEGFRRLVNLDDVTGIAILGWCALCVFGGVLMPRIEDRVRNTGLPWIPIPLLPIFFLVPYFFLARPVPHSREIGELALGVAAALWSFDLLRRQVRTRCPPALFSVGGMLGVLALIALMAGILTHSLPSLTLRHWLNRVAYVDYARLKMYDQADQIYQYIYAHPQYLRAETRLAHGRVLLKSGKQEAATTVLRDAIKELEASDSSGRNRAQSFRGRGIAFLLLGDRDSATAVFRRSVEIDQQRLAATSDPDEKAQRLWSIARTFEARGDAALAVETAEEARASATNSAFLRWEIERWVQRVSRRVKEAPVPNQPDH